MRTLRPVNDSLDRGRKIPTNSLLQPRLTSSYLYLYIIKRPLPYLIRPYCKVCSTCTATAVIVDLYALGNATEKDRVQATRKWCSSGHAAANLQAQE